MTNSDTGAFASSGLSLSLSICLFSSLLSFFNHIIYRAEAAYLLAFAIVLLATDLHSSQIKKHITKEEWLKMNRGNNAKQNYDESYLLGMYPLPFSVCPLSSSLIEH